MESDIKQKFPSEKDQKPESISRTLYYPDHHDHHALKSPIRPISNSSIQQKHFVFIFTESGFRQFQRMNDENIHDNFQSPHKLSLPASPLDTRPSFHQGSGRLEYSPFLDKITDSPYTSFAKQLYLSPSPFTGSPKVAFPGK